MIDTSAQITQGQVTERQAAGKRTTGAAPLARQPDATMSISGQSGAATEGTPGTALAQLSALRNLAMAAAANGDAMGLRQLAERAAAIGVVMLVASFILLLALNGLQSWAAKRR